MVVTKGSCPTVITVEIEPTTMPILNIVKIIIKYKLAQVSAILADGKSIVRYLEKIFPLFAFLYSTSSGKEWNSGGRRIVDGFVILSKRDTR